MPIYLFQALDIKPIKKIDLSDKIHFKITPMHLNKDCHDLSCYLNRLLLGVLEILCQSYKVSETRGLTNETRLIFPPQFRTKVVMSALSKIEMSA
jgi:hypothetical protein